MSFGASRALGQVETRAILVILLFARYLKNVYCLASPMMLAGDLQ